MMPMGQYYLALYDIHFENRLSGSKYFYFYFICMILDRVKFDFFFLCIFNPYLYILSSLKGMIPLLHTF